MTKTSKWVRIGLGFYKCRNEWQRQWLSSRGHTVYSDDDGKWWVTQFGPPGGVGPFETRGEAMLYAEGRFPRRWFPRRHDIGNDKKGVKGDGAG